MPGSPPPGPPAAPTRPPASRPGRRRSVLHWAGWRGQVPAGRPGSRSPAAPACPESACRPPGCPPAVARWRPRQAPGSDQSPAALLRAGPCRVAVPPPSPHGRLRLGRGRADSRLGQFRLRSGQGLLQQMVRHGARRRRRTSRAGPIGQHRRVRSTTGQCLPHALRHRLPDILRQPQQDRLGCLQPGGLPGEESWRSLPRRQSALSPTRPVPPRPLSAPAASRCVSPGSPASARDPAAARPPPPAAPPRPSPYLPPLRRSPSPLIPRRCWRTIHGQSA